MIYKWQNFEIDCDPKFLEYNEVNLNHFLQSFAGRYSRIVQQQKELAVELDRLYHLKFVQFKDNDGGSDKLCEARCKADPELAELRKIVEVVGGFTKAMDKAYESSTNYGHNLRKEMEKLDADIHFSTGFQGSKIAEVDSQIEDIFNQIGKTE